MLKMKKINYMILGVLGLGMAMASCQETKDDNPVFQKPTKFELNTPAFANEYYELTEDGMLEITCSQPDYGFGAITQYAVELSLDENFTQSQTITPLYPTQARIQLHDSDLAVAICALEGVTSPDDYNADDAVRTAYLRAIASIKGVEGSEITSNAIKLARVKYYPAVKSPGYIYVAGAFTGWKEPSSDNAGHYAGYRLYEAETAIGSKIYSGTFEVNAGDAMFRFYTALTGWDADSYGAQEEDNPVDCEFTDGEFVGDLVKGKGSYNFPAWEGGEMTITVNMAIEGKYTVTIYAGAVDTTPAEVIYMCGNNTNWAEPSADNEPKYDSWKLSDKEHNGVYTATFSNIPVNADDGNCYFRFYKTLSGWGAAQWASPTGDNYELILGEAAPTAEGEGCFVLTAPGDNSYVFTVDSNTNTLTVTLAE